MRAMAGWRNSSRQYDVRLRLAAKASWHMMVVTFFDARGSKMRLLQPHITHEGSRALHNTRPRNDVRKEPPSRTATPTQVWLQLPRRMEYVEVKVQEARCPGKLSFTTRGRKVRVRAHKEPLDTLRILRRLPITNSSYCALI